MNLTKEIPATIQQCYVEVDPVFFQIDFSEAAFLRKFIGKNPNPEAAIPTFQGLFDRVHAALREQSTANYSQFLDLAVHIRQLSDKADHSAHLVTTTRQKIAEIGALCAQKLPKIQKNIELCRRKKAYSCHLEHMRAYRQSLTLRGLDATNFVVKWEALVFLTQTPTNQNIKVFQDADAHIQTFAASMVEKSHELLARELFEAAVLGETSQASSRLKRIYKVAKRLVPSKYFLVQKFEAIFWRCVDQRAENHLKCYQDPDKIIKRSQKMMKDGRETLHRLTKITQKLVEILLVKNLAARGSDAHINSAISSFCRHLTGMLTRYAGNLVFLLRSFLDKNVESFSGPVRSELVAELVSESGDRFRSIFDSEFTLCSRFLPVNPAYAGFIKEHFLDLNKGLSLATFDRMAGKMGLDYLLADIEELKEWVLSGKPPALLEKRWNKSVKRLSVRSELSRFLSADKETQILLEDKWTLLVLVDDSQSFLVNLDPDFVFFMASFNLIIGRIHARESSTLDCQELAVDILGSYLARLQSRSLPDLSSLLQAVNQVKCLEKAIQFRLRASEWQLNEKTDRIIARGRSFLTELDLQVRKTIDMAVEIALTTYIGSLKAKIVEAGVCTSPSDALLGLVNDLHPLFFTLDRFMLNELAGSIRDRISDQASHRLVAETDLLDRLVKDFRSTRLNEVAFLQSRLARMPGLAESDSR